MYVYVHMSEGFHFNAYIDEKIYPQLASEQAVLADMILSLERIGIIGLSVF